MYQGRKEGSNGNSLIEELIGDYLRMLQRERKAGDDLPSRHHFIGIMINPIRDCPAILS
jgi:hypothetical protein